MIVKKSMFKKVTLLFAGLYMSAALVTGCKSSEQPASVDKTESDGSGKINVVTSFYPLYDFTQKIGGEHVQVTNLIPTGVDPHHWSPKSRDMKNVTNAQLFIYQGAGFEGWVDQFLKSISKDSSVKPIMASQGITLLPASGENDHGANDHGANDHGGHDEAGDHAKHAHDEAGHEGHAHDEAAQENHAHNETAHDDHDHGEWDPHVWLSPVNAKKMAETIKNALIEVDEANRVDYEAGFAKLSQQLDELHAEFKEGLSELPRKEIIVSHQAFGYLCGEYGLAQEAIMGISADAEPTAQDLRKINAFIREHNVKYIFFEELVSDKLASTLARDAGVDTLVLHTLEGLTDEQIKAGHDYISLMRENLKNLLKALQ